MSLADASPVTVQARNICRKMLAWECHFADPRCVARLPRVLTAIGLVETTRCEWIMEFVTAQQDSVLLVPRTGRVEIRLSYLTPHEQRSNRAREIKRMLAEGLSNAVDSDTVDSDTVERTTAESDNSQASSTLTKDLTGNAGGPN